MKNRFFFFVEGEKMDLRSQLRRIDDFPTKGIVFWDITPMLADGKMLRHIAKKMADPFRDKGITQVAAAESRGFIFGTLVAHELGAGIALFRKPGKLPFKVLKEGFQLEYGATSVEAHIDAIHERDHVLVVDDVVATGGTARAAIALVERLGGKVAGCSFLIALDYLHGMEKLKDHNPHALIRIPDTT